MLMISTLKNVVLLLNTDRVIKLCWAGAGRCGRAGTGAGPCCSQLWECCWQGTAEELAVQAVVCSFGYLKVFEVGLGTSDQKLSRISSPALSSRGRKWVFGVREFLKPKYPSSWAYDILQTLPALFASPLSLSKSLKSEIRVLLARTRSPCWK